MLHILLYTHPVHTVDIYRLWKKESPDVLKNFFASYQQLLGILKWNFIYVY